MYLDQDVVEKMYNEICDISADGSLVLVNIVNKSAVCASSEFADMVFVDKRGWTKESQIMFGDEAFNYGRYPKGMKPNIMFGFAIYKK